MPAFASSRSSSSAVTFVLINFNAALIKDGISCIVNGLEEESHAKSQGRQEHQ